MPSMIAMLSQDRITQYWDEGRNYSNREHNALFDEIWRGYDHRTAGRWFAPVSVRGENGIKTGGKKGQDWG